MGQYINASTYIKYDLMVERVWTIGRSDLARMLVYQRLCDKASLVMQLIVYIQTILPSRVWLACYNLHLMLLIYWTLEMPSQTVDWILPKLLNRDPAPNLTFSNFTTTTKIMARADKSALISKAVAAFRAGEFADYSKAATHFGVDRTSVSKRVRGLTKTRQEANLFYH